MHTGIPPVLPRHVAEPRLAAGLLILVLLAGACHWGARPRNLPVALGPQGALVTIRIKGERQLQRGELFAADSSGVTIHRGNVVRVHWARIAAIDVDGLGSDFDVLPGETVSDRKREKLALVSRFPQGLSGPVLERVLSALKQPSVEEIP